MITKFPMPYQIEGKQRMKELKSCLQSDDMGLGKTGQTILAIDEVNAFPCLIICPSTLKCNWEIEISEWTDKKGMILNDSIKNTFPLLYKAGIAQYFIVNYESLKKFFVLDMPKRKDFRLADIRFNQYRSFFKSVIIDESHRVKDPKSQQAKITAGISMGKEYVYLLSGTPVLNKTIELAPQLIIANKIHHFGGYNAFVDKYSDCSELDLIDLQEKLYKHCMIRREKKREP